MMCDLAGKKYITGLWILKGTSSSLFLLPVVVQDDGPQLSTSRLSHQPAYCYT